MWATDFAVRNSEGVWLKAFNKTVEDHFCQRPSDNVNEFFRVMKFSPDGSFLAFGNGVNVYVVDVVKNAVLHVFDLPKNYALHFSPKSSFLCTWQQYTGQDCEKNGNLSLFTTKDWAKVAKYAQKRQQDWEPLWSDDEGIFAKLMGSELQFHDSSPERYSHKLVIPKLTAFSLSRGPPPYHVAVYVAPAKGGPGSVRMFRYPEVSTNSTPVANKSFFKCDRVQMKWNCRGTAMALLTSADVDQSGASYYGEQHMYLMLTNGESFKLSLSKPGPIYHFEWNPNAAEFCVVFGFMPAKANLFNLKGEPTFDFGEGPRNEAHYNPFGNIVALCGYGNLRGGMEFWSIADKKIINKFTAEDTTYFEWASDGQHFLTATTAPRLRVNNGFKIWDYTGEVLYQYKTPVDENKHELWEVAWRPVKAKMTTPHSIQWASVEKQKKIEAAKPENVLTNTTYVPPHLRGKASGTAANKKPQIPGMMAKPTGGQSEKPNMTASNHAGGCDDNEKKIKALKKKLEQIEKLKQLRNEGKALEANQLEKIEKESEFLAELEELSLAH